MNIEFLSTVAVIAPDPPASGKLYVETLGLPLGSFAVGQRGDDPRRLLFIAYDRHQPAARSDPTPVEPPRHPTRNVRQARS